jgi:CCR4-NOT transcription complex subunit 1
MKTFYEATLRVSLIILHDYPEFLCEFHFNFVNKLPDHSIQLKNLILSAFPRHIHPPEPFSKNLKVDLLPEI